MYSLFLMAAFVVPAEAPADVAAPKLEGKWLIVYAEEGGRRNNAWEQQQAKFKDGTLVYAQEGKEQAIKVTFGPHNTLKAMVSGSTKGKKEDVSKEEAGGESRAYTGVYIAGQDYFCLSLDKKGDAKKEARKEEVSARRTAEADKAEGVKGSSFILILRRQRGDK
jgi:hypothetical protein